MYSYDEVKSATLEYFGGDELATDVFITKYALKDKEGQLLEKTPDDMHRRMAKEFARIESGKFEKPLSEEDIYNYLKNFKKIIPQGSCMYGIGNPYQYVTLSNCYVLPSPHDSYLGINYLDTQIAQISSRRGGVGWSMSTLRPKDTRVQNAAGSTTGAVSFMHRYSNTIKEVCQAGRRGASLQSLSVQHPEILDFIKCKNNDISITGSNLSVEFSNSFMEALEQNKDVQLKWPVNSNDPKISSTINSKTIWDEFIQNAWERAEPGAIFIDTVHKRSTSAIYPGFKEIAPNPCVIKGTLVNTPQGYIKVENIKRGQYVSTVIGQEPVEKIETNNNIQTYKVTFSDGGEQIVTTGHIYHAIKKHTQTKKIKKVRLDQLEIGDYIRISPSKMDDDTYTKYLQGVQTGILLGDGCYTEKQLEKKCIKIASNQDDTEYNRLLKQYVFQDYKFNKDDIDQKSKSMNLIIKIGKQKLKQLGLTPTYSHQKNFDIEKIDSLGLVIGVLDGLLATDGNINLKSNHPQIRWDTTSKELAQNIRRLLLYIGCHGFISTSNSVGGKINGRQINRNHTKYTVTISGSSIRNYIEHTQLDHIHPQKSALLQKAQIDFRLTGNYWMAKIKSIEPYKITTTYDLYCSKSDTWITDGYVQQGCGEQYLPPYGCCRLIAILLLTYVKKPFTKDAYFDYKAFSKDVKILQRLADNIVDLDIEAIDRIIDKIESDPEPDCVKQIALDLWTNIKERSQQDRRTGCGIVGLADTFAALGFRYDSEDAIDFTNDLFRTFKLAAYESSVELAKTLGPFPLYDYELDKKAEFIQDIEDDDPKLYNRMKKYGRRNMTLLTIAPTGSVSLLTQTSSGIEPVFQLKYTRRKKINPSEDIEPDFVDESGEKWSKYTVYHKPFVCWQKKSGKTSVKSSPYYKSCTYEINYERKIELQATIQNHIDNSISVTTNLPKDIDKETVAKLYLKAWRLGCKGFTVYRDGCRSGILVPEEPPTILPEERPREMPCDVHHISVRGQQYFILVGLLDGRPYEVFAGKNGFLPKKVKSGTIIRKRKNFYKATFDDADEELSPITASTEEMEEVITRLTSGLLRIGADMHFIVKQLEKVGERQTEMHSFARSVARALKKYIPDGTKEGDVCPECNSDSLFRQEGCVLCKSCSWSKCL